MLKKVDASAGTAKRLQAFKTPMACAASATSSRNGNMMRVIFTASSNLPGTWRNLRPAARPSAGTEDDAQHAKHADDQDQRGSDQIGKHRRFFSPFLRQRLREDGDERRGKRAFGEQIASEIGNAEAQQERVVDEPGAEQPRHHHFAHQSGDA